MSAIDSCPFCAIDPARTLAEDELIVSYLDGFPISPSHTLTLPRRHIAALFDATKAAQTARLHDGAFDQGLIAFDDDYRLILSKRLKDHLTHQAIRDNFACYEGKQLKLPEKFVPDTAFLAGHRGSIFQDAA